MQAFINEEVPQQEKVLYTGLTYVVPVCVNPTEQEMVSILGFNADKVKPKEYVKDKLDRQTQAVIGKTYTIDIWFKKEDGRFDKLTFWVDNIPFVSDKGNLEFIGTKGKTHFAPSMEVMQEWLKADSSLTYEVKNAEGYTEDKFYTNGELFGTQVRQALNGERILADFLLKYLKPNFKQQPDYKLELDNSITTTAGIKELNQLFKDMNSMAKENPRKIGVVYGVKGGYSNVVVLSFGESFVYENKPMKNAGKFIDSATSGNNPFEFTDGVNWVKYVPETFKPNNLNETVFKKEHNVEDMPF